jgi:2-oxo-4-hydroxy-4-carboxy-5-ureidoimidazoline decarboxylase
MTLADVNRLDRAGFVAALGGIFEHAPWVAEAAYAARPFPSVDALHAAMVAAVEASGDERQLALLRGHPELTGRASARDALTADSAREQEGAGLTQCSPAEFARLAALNARYSAKFGFPFILAVKGYDRAGILRELARRVERDRAAESAESLAQVALIARFRLDALLGD